MQLWAHPGPSLEGWRTQSKAVSAGPPSTPCKVKNLIPLNFTFNINEDTVSHMFYRMHYYSSVRLRSCPSQMHCLQKIHLQFPCCKLCHEVIVVSAGCHIFLSRLIRQSIQPLLSYNCPEIVLNNFQFGKTLLSYPHYN
jgi:hypothetical protein